MPVAVWTSKSLSSSPSYRVGIRHPLPAEVSAGPQAHPQHAQTAPKTAEGSAGAGLPAIACRGPTSYLTHVRITRGKTRVAFQARRP